MRIFVRTFKMLLNWVPELRLALLFVDCGFLPPSLLSFLPSAPMILHTPHDAEKENGRTDVSLAAIVPLRSQLSQ